MFSLLPQSQVFLPSAISSYFLILFGLLDCSFVSSAVFVILGWLFLLHLILHTSDIKIIFDLRLFNLRPFFLNETWA